MVKGGETMRVDSELAELARMMHEKNQISIRQATKEIAKIVKAKAIDKKINMELKF